MVIWTENDVKGKTRIDQFSVFDDRPLIDDVHNGIVAFWFKPNQILRAFIGCL